MKTARPKKRAKPLKIEWLIQQPLWKILAIAITDMRKQERAPNSRLDMGTWFQTNGECVACAAGSVLRWSCGVTSEREVFNRGDEWDRVRWAINSLRDGCVASALGYMRRGGFVDEDCHITEYGWNPANFWRDIRALQKQLRAANI